VRFSRASGEWQRAAASRLRRQKRAQAHERFHGKTDFGNKTSLATAGDDFLSLTLNRVSYGDHRGITELRYNTDGCPV
jgi:hypothetical protein